MIPVTNAAQTDKQATTRALLFFFVYLMLNEEIWFPKALFKLELSTTSFYKMNQIKSTDGAS